MNRRLLIIVLMACLLPLGMQAQQGTFRFAQLTDIHLTPNNPNPTEDLLRSIAQINATDSIDFVLVTGDLTEEGDRATMEKVKSCLDLLLCSSRKTRSMNSLPEMVPLEQTRACSDFGSSPSGTGVS